MFKTSRRDHKTFTVGWIFNAACGLPTNFALIELASARPKHSLKSRTEIRSRNEHDVNVSFIPFLMAPSSFSPLLPGCRFASTWLRSRVLILTEDSYITLSILYSMYNLQNLAAGHMAQPYAPRFGHPCFRGSRRGFCKLKNTWHVKEIWE